MVSGNLREHFDRAVGGDPGASPGEMANVAIAEGGRVRRRRARLVTAGVAAGVVALAGVATGVALRSDPTSPANPETVAAGMMLAPARSCTVGPPEGKPIDAAVFLDDDATAPQRAAIKVALEKDQRLTNVSFEDRATAYERFLKLWGDNPDFAKQVSPKNLPEAFRMRLSNASETDAVGARYKAMDGVADFSGWTCPPNMPAGGAR